MEPDCQGPWLGELYVFVCLGSGKLILEWRRAIRFCFYMCHSSSSEDIVEGPETCSRETRVRMELQQSRGEMMRCEDNEFSFRCMFECLQTF